MLPISLELLKTGLEKLKHDIEPRKKDILCRQKKGQRISADDKQWLDDKANLVDEERIFNTLAHAKSFETELAKLGEHGREVVEKLVRCAGNPLAKPMIKRECAYS
jgi:hypothetical protein